LPRIGRAAEKPLEINRSSRAGDLGRIHLLQTEDIRLEPFKLWAEDGRPLFEGGAMPTCATEVFEIKGGDPHGDLGQCLELLQASLAAPVRVGA
jgi:hypothetical protein